MLDIKKIRTTPEILSQALLNRGHPDETKHLLVLDAEHRALQTKKQTLLEEKNALAKQIALKKKENQPCEEMIARGNVIRELLEKTSITEKNICQDIFYILERFPNIPLEDVPIGRSESENICTKTVGTPRTFAFPIMPHDTLAESLSMADFKQASHIAGSRFVFLKGQLAQLERALAAFMIDTHTKDYGYQEVSPPLLVKPETMYGTGQLPKFSEDSFHTTDDRWLIPTAEVPITSLAAQQLFSEEELPLRYVAHTACFRSEAGAAGKDTKGLIRMHQFYKVELVSLTTPQQSKEELERMLSAAENILKKLEIPYRVVQLCTGDLGFQAAKTYDIEVWIPSQNTYREISSCSNCLDFQARRMNGRYKPKAPIDPKSKTAFIHTLNGSGLAISRTLVAILENYQNQNKTITIPNVLVPYMHGKKEISCVNNK